MERKKRFSILKLLIVILCVTSIVVSIAANILFRGNNVPNLFGRVIYVVEEDNPMSGDITTGAALISKEAKDLTVAVGDIVLCYPADSPETLCLRSVSYITEAEDGTERYFTKDSYHEDNVDSITKDKIISVCTGYPESKELGNFISFAIDVKGILILLVAASVILIALIISAVLRARGDKEEDEEDYEFYEYDEEEDENEKSNSHAKPSDPLFEPNPELKPNSEFERKKMSIAENFKPKQVNPDSPYQKEKERTMQFKAQRGVSGNTMSFSTSSAESSFAARNQGGQSSTAPTADALREAMLRKTAEAERTGTFNIRGSEPVTDNTGVLSKAQVAELSKGEAPSACTTPQRSTASAPRKSSSPDISDILGKSSSSRRKSNPSDMSVDDLLKMIEDEKRKF